MNLENLNFENYRSNKLRSKIVLYSFYFALGAALLNIFTGSYYYFELKKFIQLEIDDISTLELIYNITTILFSGSVLVTMFTFSFWFRRSYANLERIGLNIDYKNYWAVLGFIIPIISLSRPLKIAKEIDLKYQFVLEQFNEFHKKNDNSFSILTAWFIAYWFDIVVSRIINRTNNNSNEQLLDYHLYTIVGVCLTMVAIILTILMICTISKSEEDLETYIQLEELSNPIVETI